LDRCRPREVSKAEDANLASVRRLKVAEVAERPPLLDIGLIALSHGDCPEEVGKWIAARAKCDRSKQRAFGEERREDVAAPWDRS
jgi:hypothetical protein